MATKILGIFNSTRLMLYIFAKRVILVGKQIHNPFLKFGAESENTIESVEKKTRNFEIRSKYRRKAKKLKHLEII